MNRSRLVILAVIAAAATARSIWMTAPDPTHASEAGAASSSFVPPPESSIPSGKFGDAVRLGEQVFRETATFAPEFTGNQLSCSNCHLEAGRLSGAAPMWGAYVSYPAYRSKNDHVNSFEERLQECFLYSMNGKKPRSGDPVLVALESYAYFLAKGLPTGEQVPGRGLPPLAMPAQPPDYVRGAQVFAQNCASCHGPQGLGQSVDGKVVFPALWGPQSFNWGAGMASIKTAAEFIHANMPLGRGGSLSVQEAWDVASYVDSQIRPQDPRFTGDVQDTRNKFHDTRFSMYGQAANGIVLGDPTTTPASGKVQSQAPSRP
jgi:thiosulfate dehydrogenase